MTKRLLFTAAIAAACAATASAGITMKPYDGSIITPDYEVDGICYILTQNDGLAVTNKSAVNVDTLYIDSMDDPYMSVNAYRDGDRTYEGSVVVPSEVYVEELGKTLPVVKIMTGAFIDSPQLVSVSLPASITDMEDLTFSKCPNLESVELNCPITHIGILTFYNCVALKTLEIPSTVTSVDELAFYDCGIRSLTFSSKLSRLCPKSFAGAKGLKSVTIPIASPDDIDTAYGYDLLWGNNSMLELSDGCVLYVPKEGVDAYKAAPEWSNFAEIRAIGSASIEAVEATAADAAPAYNLLGQPVANPHAGDIVVRNGKKQLIR